MLLPLVRWIRGRRRLRRLRRLLRIPVMDDATVNLWADTLRRGGSCSTEVEYLHYRGRSGAILAYPVWQTITLRDREGEWLERAVLTFAESQEFFRRLTLLAPNVFSREFLSDDSPPVTVTD